MATTVTATALLTSVKHHTLDHAGTDVEASRQGPPHAAGVQVRAEALSVLKAHLSHKNTQDEILH